MIKNYSLIEILEQILIGTHDPSPTRAIYFKNEQAMKVDTWWQEYYTSNDKSLKMLARIALEIVNKEKGIL